VRSEFRCPHCEAVSTPDAGAGAIVECGQCDQSSIVPEASPVAQPLNGDARPAETGYAATQPVAGLVYEAPTGTTARAPSDVPLTRSGVVAALFTVVFYLLVVRSFDETYFGQLFGQRGWVPYVISFLSFWSGALLVAKYRVLSRQRRILEVALLPLSIAERVTPETAPRFLAHLREASAGRRENYLVQRLVSALEHFAARGQVRETIDQLRSHAERDENVVESSFTMLRVFIWAVPILGFIGTVLGIGASVGGFSESVSAAADLEVMKDSIGTVTSGLGVAFDTTLLALVMSIFIMFPTSSLQKAEEDFLTQVDDYCRRNLIARLDDQGESAGSDDDRAVDRLAKRLLAAMGTQGEREVH
jgi:biopolymer transport protein ExbB/TolQ